MSRNISVVIALCIGGMAHDVAAQYRSLSRPPGKVNAPSVPWSFRCPAGITGEDVYVFKDPTNDLINDAQNARFFYTPPFFFKRLSREETAMVEVKYSIDGDVALVSLFLVRSHPEVESCIRRGGNRTAGRSLESLNVEAVPLGVLNVAMNIPQVKECLADWIFPDPQDLDTQLVPLGDEVKVTFTLPSKCVDSFTYYVQIGVDFVIRYGFSSVETSESTLSGQTKIEVSAEAERNFFGDRNKVLASKDQVARLFLDSKIQQRWSATIGNERIGTFILSAVDRFLAQTAASAIKLGDVAQETLTSYGLSLDDDFFKLDFTDSTMRQFASTKDDLSSYADFYQKYNNKSAGGGGKILWGLIGGGGGKSGASGESIGKKTIRQHLEEIASADSWTGRKTEALDIRLHEVNRAALRQHVETQIDFTVIADPSVSKIAFPRNTVRHTWVRGGR